MTEPFYRQNVGGHYPPAMDSKGDLRTFKWK